MNNPASPADRRRRVLLLRVGGFASLMLAFFGSFACIALAVVAIVDGVGEFHTLDVPGQAVVSLSHRHFVIYYESNVAAPESVPVPGLTVSVRPSAGAQSAVPISDYANSFSFTVGSYFGRAVATFNPPRAGRYVITSSNPDAPTGSARIVIGPSILGLLGHDLVPGVLAAILLFFAAGGVGAWLLTLADRRAAPPQPSATPAPV